MTQAEANDFFRPVDKPAAGGPEKARVTECACSAMSFVGEGTPLAGWHPAKLLPLRGERKNRWLNRWADVEQARKDFADLNDGTPWAPRPNLTQPTLKSVAVKESARIAKDREESKTRSVNTLTQEHRAMCAQPIINDDRKPAPIAALAFLSGARVAKQAFDGEKVGNAGTFGDGDVLPVLFDDAEEEAAHDEEALARRKPDPSTSVGPRFRGEAGLTWDDVGPPETWRAALPPRPKKLKPVDPEWFLDDRGRPLMSDASCPLGHVTDSGVEDADYDGAVRTGNGVRPGEVVRIGESVRTGVDPQREPHEKENPGMDVPAPALTCRPLSTPRMPGLAPSWGTAPSWTIQVAVWMPKAMLAREADGLLSAPVAPVIIEAPAQIDDEWTHVIRNFAYGRDRVSVDQVGRHVVKKFGGQIGKKEQLRIVGIFADMGWARCRTKSGRGFLNSDRHQLSQ
ncbi:MAG TPA: hypothetical protein VFE60_22000 [Roseiarcus sp.]|jgi:hypothetical protein|nr:hypothetical protein [Roseiarcus sp.]